MLFGLKNQPFVSATFHRSRHGFAPEAIVAAIGRPKMAYLNVDKIIKIKVLNGFDSFLCYWAAKMYGYICLEGSRKFVCSVIIWEQDSAFVFSHIVLDDVQLIISPWLSDIIEMV